MSQSAPVAARRLVVVLGMHRSGTSAVARGLQAFGVDLGDNLLPPVIGNNDKGFFEDIDVYSLNNDLLAAIGSAWDDPAPADFSSLPDGLLKSHESRARDLLAKKTLDSALFGLKDPRFCRLLPFWKPVFRELGLETRFVLVLRNPLSSAQSLARRDGLPVERSLYLWASDMFSALDQTPPAGRIAIDFDRLMADPGGQMKRVARFLGLPCGPAEATRLREYETEFLEERLRHFDFTVADLKSDRRVPAVTRDIYALVAELASDRPPEPEEVEGRTRVLRERMDELQHVLRSTGGSSARSMEAPSHGPVSRPPDGLASEMAVYFAPAGKDFAETRSVKHQMVIGAGRQRFRFRIPRGSTGVRIDPAAHPCVVKFWTVAAQTTDGHILCGDLLGRASIREAASIVRREPVDPTQPPEMICLGSDPHFIVDLNPATQAALEGGDVDIDVDVEPTMLAAESPISTKDLLHLLDRGPARLEQAVTTPFPQPSAAGPEAPAAPADPLEALLAERDAALGELDSARDADGILRQERDAARQDLASANDAIGILRQERDAARRELDSLQTVRGALLHEHGAARKELGALQQKLASLLADRDSARDALSSLRASLATAFDLPAGDETPAAGHDGDAFKAAVATLGSSIDAACSRMKRLQDELGRLAPLASRVRDLDLVNGVQRARLARLASELATLLNRADRTERALRAALEERDAAARGLEAKIEGHQNELRFIKSTRAWRTREQALRLRFWLRDRLARPAPGDALRALPGPAASDPAADRPLGAAPFHPERLLAAPSDGASPPGLAAGGSLAEPGAATPGRSVLFISHDAQPHGAQIFLLRLLRWLRANSELRFEVLLGGDGPLRRDFEEVARVSTYPAAGVPAGPLPTDDPLLRRLREAGVGLIYSNTIVNGKILEALGGLDVPVITHVHEMGFWMSNRIDPGDLRRAQERTDLFVAVSEAVKASLVDRVSVDPAAVKVIYGYVPPAPEATRRAERMAKVREDLGIPADAGLVGGCGTLDWRKAPDLFVQVARLVRKRLDGSRPVHFLWVGGEREGLSHAELRHDARLAGLDSALHFVGHVPDARDYIAALDVFVLPSREDPFPLVNLEAASLGIPTVCFDASGGSREFVEDDCGFVVPYLDLDAMADRITDILVQPGLRARLGRRAAEKVRERHDVDVIGPLLLAEILDGLEGRRPEPEGGAAGLSLAIEGVPSR